MFICYKKLNIKNVKLVAHMLYVFIQFKWFFMATNINKGYTFESIDMFSFKVHF